MEEDTGKSLHIGGATGRIHGADHSLVDYNRAGIPLIEIVTKPMVGAGERAPEVAKAYVSALRDLLRALDVSDVKMEQGSMRCDANVSLRPRVGEPAEPRSSSPCRSAPAPRRRTSTRSARSSGPCATRSRATRRSSTAAARSCRRPGTGTRTPASRRRAASSPTPRTTATSPSPTSCPSRRRVRRSRRCAGTLPEPPALRRKRLQSDWGYSDLEMRDVVNAGAVELIEETVAAGASAAAAKKWWLGEPSRRANAEGQDIVTYAAGLGLTPAHIAELDGLVAAGRLNDSMARQVLDGVLAGEGTPDGRRRRPRARARPGRRRPRGRRRQGHRGQPRRRGEDPRRQGGRPRARSSVR